jgi:NADH-ubiquinone oxidoreductase chain 1
LDLLKGFLCYLILIICVLVAVAFVTLLEQKILAGAQVRVGPNYVGVIGLFQPFADAVKLFNKGNLVLRSRVIRIYFIGPVLSLGLRLVLWLRLPFMGGALDLNLSIFFFVLVRGVGVFPILMRGWRSNCKYSTLGSLRAVAQMVSYEVRLGIVLLSFI